MVDFHEHPIWGLYLKLSPKRLVRNASGDLDAGGPQAFLQGIEGLIRFEVEFNLPLILLGIGGMSKKTDLRAAQS